MTDSSKRVRKISGESIEYDWVKGNFIVPERLIDILCSQNVYGDKNPSPKIAKKALFCYSENINRISILCIEFTACDKIKRKFTFFL